MKLFYIPGSCSLAPHILAREAGVDLALIRVERGQSRTESGADFKALNPSGYVPFLQLEDGRGLSECAVILQYLADQAPTKGLIPPAGHHERYLAQQWLNYIAAELHTGCYTILLRPAYGAEVKPFVLGLLQTRLAYVDRHLSDHDFLLGPNYSVADIYLWVTCNWAQYVGLDLTSLPALHAWHQRIGARPAVQTALRTEGLNFKAAAGRT
ncbi:glutathione transferase GstA [Denitratisoma sp. DHT3]|uniref:glutathione transferase GstA n=1 Tax=Denitratisoma sp. DHT3 TaxID=1981880 RepID=UPI0011985B02|nr:glutathione transferase GstA [Denitratisoma sp. DHT3]QDX82394.1 glutathione transferase GstA [Denitratisoma sp. DHT3]